MESLAEDLKLSACGRQPLFFSKSFDLICLFCFVCVVFFRNKCLLFKFEEAFSYVTPDLSHPFGIVCLNTLGTMCHVSLGVG
jgi:hypothetical protein